MLKIAIPLGFIDIINTSWQQLETLGWNVRSLSKKYQEWQMVHFFDVLVLLTSISSETSILS